MKVIPYGRQEIDNQDIQAVVEVLKSDYLTQGPAVGEFEQKFSEFCNSKYSISVNNGTAGLHLAYLALGLGLGDTVLTTPLTFAATSNAVLYTGADVDFVDIDPETYLIDIEKLEAKLSESPEKYKGIAIVAFAGHPSASQRLRSLADKYGVWIVEDACHAVGAGFENVDSSVERVGSGKFADISVFSFHPVKHITTGEGGMVTTNREELYEAMVKLRSHGMEKNPDLLEKKNQGGWYHEMQMLGFNYRMTDIQAALGSQQLKKIESNVSRRIEVANKYNEAFKDLDLKTPFVAKNAIHSYHLYAIQCKQRRELYDYLRERKIYTQVHYLPVHMHPFYRKRGWSEGDYPIAEEYYSKALSLPMYHSLTTEDQERVIKTVQDFLDI